MLDGYLKTLHARENPEQAAILQANLHEQIRYNKLAFDFVPDYTQETFDPLTSVSWGSFSHFVIMEVFFIAHCVTQKIVVAIQTRKAIIYIDVLN